MDNTEAKTFWEGIETRRGQFFISEQTLRNNPRLVQNIMSQVIVTQAEFLHTAQTFRYYAYSHLFDEAPLGKEVPDYEFFEDEFNDVGLRQIKR